MPHVSDILHLIGGALASPEINAYEDVFNPSTGEVIARVPLAERGDVERVVSAAAAALPDWSRTPVVERARLMFRFRDTLERRSEELAQLVTRENGKTLGEARAEIRRGIEVVEFACGAPTLLMGQSLTEIAKDVDATVLRHPVGVCVGVTPYNFPAMVPMWMFPIALVCGNTFILKPSEKVPLTAMMLGELLLEAGCPEGVFNVVHGGQRCVQALLEHPQTAAVSFVGSTPIAKSIYREAVAAGKRVQAAGGAKNYSIIMPDADPDLVVKAIAAASFGCGGQRCMATSIAIPIGRQADAFIERLASYAQEMRIGPTDDGQDVDLGPLISREHVGRVASFLDSAKAEGATIALDGREACGDGGFFLRPSIVDQVAPAMKVAREEIFGPLLSVVRAATLDDALQMSNQCEFGNGASIFTRDGYAARRFREEVNAGMIGVNVGVPAPMAWFPFTGWNGSFFGDLHVQGMEGIQFYTRQKVSLTRWPEPNDTDHRDAIWRTD